CRTSGAGAGGEGSTGRGTFDTGSAGSARHRSGRAGPCREGCRAGARSGGGDGHGARVSKGRGEAAGSQARSGFPGQEAAVVEVLVRRAITIPRSYLFFRIARSRSLFSDGSDSGSPGAILPAVAEKKVRYRAAPARGP